MRGVLLLLAGLLALVPAWAEAKLSVVATTEHYAAVARTIGGDRVSVTYLARGSQDPHAVLPKRSFSVPLNRADLLIVNGQGLETAWLPTALTESTNNRIREGKPGYLDASTGATLIPYDPAELKASPLVRTLVALQSLALPKAPDVAAANNHHYWLDPANGLAMAKAILDRLSLLDPSNTAFFQANHDRFAATLYEKLLEWDARMRPFEGTAIVSAHRSWTYLARRHGLKIVAYIEPSEPLILSITNVSNPPDRDEKTALIAKMGQSRVKLIVAESYQDPALLQEIARATGASVLALPASVSETDGVDDYFVLFDQIYRKLTQALGAARTLR
ncbi:MAG: zinc ABC transporter substrate-binding protein [Candidatus Rokubacteria bacterium]|nr:zinc ABC transporter substrate-binding protein [Candidatus Rokubacteria bacterium]